MKSPTNGLKEASRKSAFVLRLLQAPSRALLGAVAVGVLCAKLAEPSPRGLQAPPSRPVRHSSAICFLSKNSTDCEHFWLRTLSIAWTLRCLRPEQRRLRGHRPKRPFGGLRWLHRFGIGCGRFLWSRSLFCRTGNRSPRRRQRSPTRNSCPLDLRRQRGNLLRKTHTVRKWFNSQGNML